MQHTQSSYITVLLFIIGGIARCLAVKQITVLEGETLILTCPLNNTTSDSVEWRNPGGFIIFFNRQKGLPDKRLEVLSLTKSEYSITLSNATFLDGGVYKCIHYSNRISTRRYKVLVLSAPVLKKEEHKDYTVVTCTASANLHAPRLSWLVKNGLEVETLNSHNVVEDVDKKHSAISQLRLRIHRRKVTVKCLVKHSALYTTLMGFINLQNSSIENSPRQRTTTTLVSTKATVISTQFSRTNKEASSTEEYSSSTVVPTETPIISTTTPPFNITTYTIGYSESGTTDSWNDSDTTWYNDTEVNVTTEFIETTEGIPPNSSSSTDGVGDGNWNINKRSSEKGNSVLLVLLVTCLIICLIIVLAFFLLRLRRAHIAWKKENEESDQSVESSRSKSSNEEKQKQTQEQSRRGFWNTSFTKYKVEETPEKDSRAASASIEIIHEHQLNVKSGIKETEL